MKGVSETPIKKDPTDTNLIQTFDKPITMLIHTKMGAKGTSD